jgi:predicted HTH domain antitoxin
MTLAIEIPEAISRALQAKWGDVPQHAREAVAVEAYRSGALTEFEVQQMLGLKSRWETEAFLKRAQAHLDYDEADLEGDLAAIRRAAA